MNPVMVAPMEGAAEGQDVDEWMDEELPVEELSARVVRKPGEPMPEEPSPQPTRKRTCRSATWCLHCVSCRASDPAHGLTERAEGDPPMVQIDHQFASERTRREITAEQVVTAEPMVAIFMATLERSLPLRSARRALSPTWQRSSWVSLRPGGLGSGTLVLRADQETGLTTLLDETKAWRAETLVERTAVESHQSFGAVERTNREEAGLLRTLKAGLEARISGKVALDHDLISWLIRHSAWLITRFRVRASGHTANELIRQRKYGGAIVEFGDIVWARILTTKELGKLDQRCVEVVWAGKAEGSDELIVMDHRGASRFRAVCRELEGGTK